jgi:thiamine pyrophosphate-dependent acetolactate synthase large subunit-like protein
MNIPNNARHALITDSMAVNRPAGTPLDADQLRGNFSLVAQGLGAYTERMEQPGDLIRASRCAIRATEDGRAALVEVMVKPMRTPELPDDWSL